MPGLTPELGVIEGYFGRTWSAEDRSHVIHLLAAAGYRYFHHAPKADASLRRDWRRPFTAAETSALLTLGETCHAAGLRFGVGLTPYGANDGLDPADHAALAAKLEALDDAGIDDLVLMFDDMPAHQPETAARQVDIAAFARARSRATRHFLTPSFYSHDSVLDRIFGPRPADYWAVLADGLDPSTILYWTGEEVCAREVRPGHLAEVSAMLHHPIALWDNYPVNDGPRMSAHLHLRAFTGRSPAIAPHLAAHAINPMSQPRLGCIAALTLPMLYARGEAYSYMQAFEEAARAVVGEPLAHMLQDDLLLLQDLGLARLGDRLPRLQARYAAVDHPAAREVVDWLAGRYAIDTETVETQ
jgi:hyaluronoglucosaminidase